MAFGGLAVAVPMHVAALHRPASLAGQLLASVTVAVACGALGAAPLGRLVGSARNVLAASMLVTALGQGVLLLAATTALMLVGTALVGAGIGLFWVSNQCSSAARPAPRAASGGSRSTTRRTRSEWRADRRSPGWPWPCSAERAPTRRSPCSSATRSGRRPRSPRSRCGAWPARRPGGRFPPHPPARRPDGHRDAAPRPAAGLGARDDAAAGAARPLQAVPSGAGGGRPDVRRRPGRQGRRHAGRARYVPRARPPRRDPDAARLRRRAQPAALGVDEPRGRAALRPRPDRDRRS